MATPTPPANRAAPQIEPARGVALALVSVLLVVTALALDAVVYPSTFSERFASVHYGSPLIIAATVGALTASAGAIITGMWENRHTDQTLSPQRLRARLARTSIGVGLLALVAIAGLYGSVFYVVQACSAFPGCE
jgi:hypothetical protein